VKPLVFGSRGSALALAQSRQVMAQLQAAWPTYSFEMRVIKTQGDRLSEDPNRPMDEKPGKGLFTGELERALRAGEIDIAVHSLKDLPTEEAEGLTLVAIPRRADARDVLISRYASTLDGLPSGSLVATGSPRRAAQMRAWRKDIDPAPIRGNIDTRLRKFREHEEWAGLILAAAGLERLRPDLKGLTVTPLPFAVMLPAPGQGALALQTRAGAEDIRELVRVVHHAETAFAVAAERSFLHALGGGCQQPIAAYGRLEENELLTLEGVAFLNGKENRYHLSGSVTGPLTSARKIGQELAQSFLERVGA